MSGKEPEKWKSIKVRESTYEDLQRMGKGISKAIDMLVEEKKEKIETELGDLKEVSNEVAKTLMEYGVFDIRFTGVSISDIEEDGDVLRIKGFIGLRVPNAEARERLIEILSRKPVEETTEGEEENG